MKKPRAKRSEDTGINDEGRWHLTPKGYLLSNTIISDLLIAQDESRPMGRLF